MTGLHRRWTRLEHKLLKYGIGLGVLAVCGFGALAFVRRGLWEYMTLRQQFVFFDFNQSLGRSFLDYALMLAMFMGLGCLLGCALQAANKHINDWRKAR